MANYDRNGEDAEDFERWYRKGFINAYSFQNPGGEGNDGGNNDGVERTPIDGHPRHNERQTLGQGNEEPRGQSSGQPKKRSSSR